MIALTVPEVRRLAQALTEPVERRVERLRWSHWRRRHQATAARCHAARRARRHPPPADQAAPIVAVPGTPALTDERWERVAPRLQAPAGRRGRRPIEHRRVLGGLLWVMRTGAAWREAPAEFGPWQTLYSRYTRWQGDGTWASILRVLLADAPHGTAAS